MQDSDPFVSIRIVPYSEGLRIMGIKETTARRLALAHPAFPKAVLITDKRKGLKLSDIEAWNASRKPAVINEEVRARAIAASRVAAERRQEKKLAAQKKRAAKKKRGAK